MNDLNAAIAREIRAHRARAGLNVRQLAEAAGFSYDTYKRYDSGERAITAATLNAVAVAMGTTAATIWLDAEAHSPEAFAVGPIKPTGLGPLTD